MLLKGNFIPEFHICCPRRFSEVFVWRRVRNPVLCLYRNHSSSCWDGSSLSYPRWKNMEAQDKDKSLNIRQSVISGSSIPGHLELAFDRLQVCDEELYKGQKRPFGRFVARGAALDEEYWTAAWLRAEAQFESVSYMRYVDSCKRKYAEREFYSLKRRCTGRDGNSLKCICIVAVKKEDPKVKRTVLNSVVGTLDLSIRQFLQGETFPGELKKASSVLVSRDARNVHAYAYIANVCVSKFARRQGIASNMLYFATDVAVSSGMKQLFVHVNADNRPAQDLYKKTGFEFVAAAASPMSKDQLLLMGIDL